MVLLQPLTFSKSLTEDELLLPRYIRTISLHLISWIALAPHQLMDQSSPAMMQTLVMTFLDSEIGLSCSSFSFCTTTLLSLRLSLRSAFTLHPYYFIAFDLVNSSCTPAADGFAITGVSAVTVWHVYFSRSARLTADLGFTLHQYYFFEVDLVNCFCTTSILFHWQLGSSRSAKGFLTNLGIALQQFFFMECVQHLFVNCNTTFVLSHCIWSHELLLRSISWWISHHRGWCRPWRWHFYSPKLDWVAANSVFALQPCYFIEVDFAKCFYTTSVLSHCLWSRE